MAAGIFLLGVSPVLCIASFIAGIAVLILLSISWMRVSGGVKENYFHRGRTPSQRFSPAEPATQEPVNIWDQLTGQEET